ncbi:MAG: hypothetical protein N2508_03700 [Anaerolineae bacterium]|nr:hypothetical protein [Anaerolineae bacterium]
MRKICPFIAILAVLCFLHLGSVRAAPWLGFTSTPEPTSTPGETPVPTDTLEPTYTPEWTPVPTNTLSPSPSPTEVPATPTTAVNTPSPTEQARPVATPLPSPTNLPELLLPQSGADAQWIFFLPLGILLAAAVVICCRRVAHRR